MAESRALENISIYGAKKTEKEWLEKWSKKLSKEH